MDLAGGNDTVQLSGAGNNNVTLANVEPVTGNGSNDVVTSATTLSGGTVNLAGSNDSDRLTLAGRRRQRRHHQQRGVLDRRQRQRRHHHDRCSARSMRWWDLGAGRR